MGTLFLVSTPIGNLEDITLRALEVLKSVDFVLCEDTRVTGKLLKHFRVESRLIPFNEFNEESKASWVIDRMISGSNVALVSDAGTPLISDPGYKLTRDAIRSGVKVEVIPGASAPIAALTVSGKPPDKFLFVGYLPKKDTKRTAMLKDLKSVRETLKTTIIFFESPYRIVKSLKTLEEIFGDIEIAVCRELTKMHEETRRENVSNVIEHFSKVPAKGEFTVVF